MVIVITAIVAVIEINDVVRVGHELLGRLSPYVIRTKGVNHHLASFMIALDHWESCRRQHASSVADVAFRESPKRTLCSVRYPVSSCPQRDQP